MWRSRSSQADMEVKKPTNTLGIEKPTRKDLMVGYLFRYVQSGSLNFLPLLCLESQYFGGDE